VSPATLPLLIKAAALAADDTRVSHLPERSRRRTTIGGLGLACLLAVSVRSLPALAQEAPAATPGTAAAGPLTPADLADLDAALDAAERSATAAAEDLFQAQARSAELRVAIDDVATRADEARGALTRRVRQIYMTGKPDPFSRMMLGLGEANGLPSVARAGVESDRTLIAEVDRESVELDTLRRSAAASESALRAKERAVTALQARTVALLNAAQIRYADDQVKLAALAQRRVEIEAQESAVRVAVAQRLQEEKNAAEVLRAQREEAAAALDKVSAAQPQLPGVRPAVTARGQRAAAAEAPVIAALEAAGSGMPAGYRATGRTITGTASWYGPGFYGKPTATGAPYDAERYTCAMLAVPLGTVVRVTTEDGRAINVLVNDRGPYVGDRVIDMSAIGARTLGYSGIRKVTIEVLEPVG